MHPLKLQPVRRVIVVRALPGLGDLLCAVPALRALRAGMPEAEITMLGLPWARSFFERFGDYVDDFLEFPGYPGIPEGPLDVRTLPRFLKRMQKQCFDLAIQMHGSGVTSNAFTMLLGARATAGFFLPGNYCPDERYFLPYDERESEAGRYVCLMRFLGMPDRGEHLEFPLFTQDFRDLEAIHEAGELREGEYVCVHPGAQDLHRRWPVERFAAVADALAARGFQVVLTGTAAETGLTRALARQMRARPIDLAGRTNLGALAALLKGARLLVCNDTGVSHLADALQVPSVVIFTATEPSRWAPIDRALHRVVQKVDGAPPRTAVLPSVMDVLYQAADLVGKEAAYAS
ncbi:MAG: glycosyltransferase family 9 protein [Chloroflexia bacterium]